MSPRMTRHDHESRRTSKRPTRVGAALAVAATGAGLIAAPALADSPAQGKLLHVGSHGRQVKKVQRALHLPQTGKFNKRTRRAVRHFQHKDGLIIDGVVGPQTWDKLFHITPPPSTASSDSTSGVSSAGNGYTIPSAIVQCESHGNYSAVNPTTGAGGAYQILPSTWQAYGGQGLPQDASPSEQGRIASEIYASQGGSAWTC